MKILGAELFIFNILVVLWQMINIISYTKVIQVVILKKKECSADNMYYDTPVANCFGITKEDQKETTMGWLLEFSLSRLEHQPILEKQIDTEMEWWC